MTSYRQIHQRSYSDCIWQRRMPNIVFPIMAWKARGNKANGALNISFPVMRGSHLQLCELTLSQNGCLGKTDDINIDIYINIDVDIDMYIDIVTGIDIDKSIMSTNIGIDIGIETAMNMFGNLI